MGSCIERKLTVVDDENACGSACAACCRLDPSSVYNRKQIDLETNGGSRTLSRIFALRRERLDARTGVNPGRNPLLMIPLWIKIAYTLFVVITVAVYSVKYSPGNFLWFSDIGLLATVPALWLESSLLASMMTVGLLLPEVLWNASYFWQLLTGKRISGLTDYMFDSEKPLYLRALSLFHVFLPVLLLWLIARLGYAPDALIAQTALAAIVLPLCYWLTDPQENVNWVFGPGARPQKRLPPLLYLALIMAAFPLLIFLPTHFLLLTLFG